MERTNHFDVTKAEALLKEWPQNGQISDFVIGRYEPQYGNCDAVESEPDEVLAPHVPLELAVTQPADPKNVLLRVQPGPHQLHSLLDVGNAAGMHASADEEEVEPETSSTGRAAASPWATPPPRVAPGGLVSPKL